MSQNLLSVLGCAVSLRKRVVNAKNRGNKVITCMSLAVQSFMLKARLRLRTHAHAVTNPQKQAQRLHQILLFYGLIQNALK